MDSDREDDGVYLPDSRSKKRKVSVGSVTGQQSASLLREKIPPIVASLGDDWQKRLKELKSTNAFFEAKFVGKRLHITCATAISFRAVQRQLSVMKIPFHTFALKEEAELKTVIRGLPAGTPGDDVKMALEELGFSPTTVTPLERKVGGERFKTNSLYVRFRKVGSWAKIWDLESVLGVRVSVDRFTSRPGVPQCYRCQSFHHSSAFCSQEPRCVKCGATHLRADCPVEGDTPPKCCNCGGAHTASWRGCPAYKRVAGLHRGRSAAGTHAPVAAPKTSTGPVSVPRTSAKKVPVAAPVTLRPDPPRPATGRPVVSYAAAVTGGQNVGSRHRRRNRARKEAQGTGPSAQSNNHVSVADSEGVKAVTQGETNAVAVSEANEPLETPSDSTLPDHTGPQGPTRHQSSSSKVGHSSERYVSVPVIVEAISEITRLVLGPAIPPAELLAAILSVLSKIICNGSSV